MYILQWRPRDSFWGKHHDEDWNNDVWLFYSRRDNLQHQLDRRDKLNATNRFYEYRVIDERGVVIGSQAP